MKKAAYLLWTMMILFTLTGCVDAKKAVTEEKTTSSQNLTIGILPDVDSIPLIIAQEKGFFQEEGLTVHIESFKSPVDRDSALQSGNLDGAISDVLAVAFAKDNGFDVQITSMTNGSYKLLVNKDTKIKDIQELKDKAVGISKNTIIEYTTDKILIERGMNPEDIHKVVVPKIPARLEMLQVGKIDGATLPEPLATIAIEGGAKLLDSSDHLGVNPGILMFTTDTLEKKAEEIKAMYRAYNKAITLLNEDPIESYIDVLIAKGGFPEAVKGKIILPNYTKAVLPSPKDVKEVITWLYERELIKSMYKYEDLVTNQFVR